jgi:hypothetical protein
MATTPLPPLPEPPVFATAYLDHRRVPEVPLPRTLLDTPPKKAHPLAASAQPAEFYTQYKCPICRTTIAEKHGADFIGHYPCRHRGPCPKSRCIRAYYGTSKKWATPYSGTKPLYCQAAGCGRKIEGWCYVKAIITPQGKGVLPISVRDPALDKAWDKARAKRAEEERQAKKEEERKKRRDLASDMEDIFSWRALGTCILGVLCCWTICCGPWWYDD